MNSDFSDTYAENAFWNFTFSDRRKAAEKKIIIPERAFISGAHLVLFSNLLINNPTSNQSPPTPKLSNQKHQQTSGIPHKQTFPGIIATRFNRNGRGREDQTAGRETAITYWNGKAENV